MRTSHSPRARHRSQRLGFVVGPARRRSPTSFRTKPPPSSRVPISRWCRTIAPPATRPTTSRPSRADEKFKKDFWQAEVTKMIKVYGAPIDDARRRQDRRLPRRDLLSIDLSNAPALAAARSWQRPAHAGFRIAKSGSRRSLAASNDRETAKTPEIAPRYGSFPAEIRCRLSYQACLNPRILSARTCRFAGTGGSFYFFDPAETT